MLTSQDVAAVAKADELLAEGQALLQRVPPATLVSAPIPGPRLALHAPFAERAADGAWAVPAAGRVVEGSAAGRVAWALRRAPAVGGLVPAQATQALPALAAGAGLAAIAAAWLTARDADQVRAARVVLPTHSVSEPACGYAEPGPLSLSLSLSGLHPRRARGGGSYSAGGHNWNSPATLGARGG